ncbi:MAG: glycosyltransferase family 9 protein [Anaerolineae bacterium]
MTASHPLNATPKLPLRAILVVKLADIGDVITSTPALRALRQTYPDARLDILVTPHSAPALTGTGLVDTVIRFDKFQFDRPADALRPASLRTAIGLAADLRRRRYDAVVILHHLTLPFGRLKYAALATATGAKYRAGLDNGHGWFLTHRARDAGFGTLHEVQYWLQAVETLGATTKDISLAAPYLEEAEAWAEQRLAQWSAESGRRPFVVIHPGSGGYSLARRWPIERFAELARALSRKFGLDVVFVGTPADNVDELERRYHGTALNLAGQTTLPQLAAVLRRAALFIGADSGVMHLAAAAGTPVIALFGPTNADAWGPWTAGKSRAIVLQAGLPCQPCAYVGHAIGRREGCPDMDCMRAIQVADVMQAADAILASFQEHP